MTTPSAPSPDLNTRILLIGAGFIATEYVKALNAMGYKQIGVLSLKTASAEKFAQTHQLIDSYGGGQEALPGLLPQYDTFIIASPIETLRSYAEFFAKAGITRVLIEKPSFLFSADLKSFLAQYPTWDAAVALNRLYYPSVTRLRQIIAEEGITSAEFSFTEWVHRIVPQDYSTLVLQRWGLSNCIHVISTAFDLIGLPATLQSAQHCGNSIVWHPAGSIFVGHGISAQEVPFTYQSDWNSAGRWWITIRTPKGAYTLCPMEGIEFTPKGSVQKEQFLPVWDEPTKCGFTPMLQAWLEHNNAFSLRQLPAHIQAIEQIFGYSAAA